jgi:hypothetical protein
MTESYSPNAYTSYIIVATQYEAQELKNVTFSNVTVHCRPVVPDISSDPSQGWNLLP